MLVSKECPKKEVRTALYTGLQIAGCAVVGSVATVRFLPSPLSYEIEERQLYCMYRLNGV